MVLGLGYSLDTQLRNAWGPVQRREDVSGETLFWQKSIMPTWAPLDGYHDCICLLLSVDFRIIHSIWKLTQKYILRKNVLVYISHASVRFKTGRSEMRRSLVRRYSQDLQNSIIAVFQTFELRKSGWCDVIDVDFP